MRTAVEELIAAGVPAAALTDARRVHLHPQHQARGYAEDTPDVVLGSLPVFACRSASPAGTGGTSARHR